MYHKKIVAAIKVGGQVLKETSDRVVLPFGSEYSVLLKNLDSIRVQIKVSIDSKDATEGTWLILEPNSSLELERFIRNGNLDKGNRFKFIERTKQIEGARGVKVDDGLVRIEYKKEYIAPKTIFNDVYVNRYHYYDDRYPYWPYRPYKPWGYPYSPYWTCNNINTTTTGLNSSNTTFTQSGQSRGSSAGNIVKTANINFSNVPIADAGITVPGGESNQKFQSVSGFTTESQSEVIVLHLVGTNEKNIPVKKAVTARTKPTCVTCHKVNKPTQKFCGRCGTALEII